jgi:hypothetical protein
MAQTIKIKRSTSTATPDSLAVGELAYSGNSNKLFIGHPDGETGVIAIGGQYYTGVIDGATAAATGDKLVLRDASGNFSAGTITAALTGNVTGTVSSISNHNTDNLTEGTTNLYYTNARSRAAISVSGDLTYDSSTGVISYTDGAAPVQSVNSQTGAVTLDTDDISEGSTNLYYTNARVDTQVDALLKHNLHSNISVADGTGDDAGKLVLTAASQYADSDARGAISVGNTGATNIGSLGYSSSTGVITYTAPSKAQFNAEVNDSLIAGTGVTKSTTAVGSDVTLAIGQAVGTTDDVTFNDVTVSGTLTSNDITSSAISIDGNATITGNLTVEGTTTTVNSTSVEVGDNILILNKQLADNTAPTLNAGLEVYRGTGTDAKTAASLLWNETQDYWTIAEGDDAGTTSRILSASNFSNAFTGTLDGGSF